MRRIERDFITLFNCFWYRDFPVYEGEYINRANWTIHLGLVVRQCATLLGARAYFEQGGRTDAVLKYQDGKTLSNVEWEWIEAHKDKVQELDKLLVKNDDTEFSTFISYSTPSNLDSTLGKASAKWAQANKPLIFFLITFSRSGGNRHFDQLLTYVFWKGKYKKVRSQPALPWDINRAKFNKVQDPE
ncbi:MAG TPA: hypothetical protein VJA19_20665 [Pseudomonas sp.]|nr:hypothetical protein [Pseudomonas sp.]